MSKAPSISGVVQAARGRDCAKLSADLAARAGEVTNSTVAVATKYLIGTGLALAVQIGRNTILRTSYVQSQDAILIDKASPLFAVSDSLKTGDEVVFSGSLVRGDPPACIVTSAGNSENGRRGETGFSGST